ncbi:hypothetical protein K450DRAFT_261480 [Umbelopsis ramanniana AG]|uniref:Uncharacterized protein n=1 Tax=Umbelopsis ramanniana AG TaxID=1314678 RepID=A0AAD5E1E3_UMBRA|nr:uncharacterized protein K450DRAFT_261480 [Umbelopsis ramanniana AG]KAI8575498.1 hypothetical protein K450DRAFT_261480 [Umbelopsis ramanniana AG]
MKVNRYFLIALVLTVMTSMAAAEDVSGWSTSQLKEWLDEHKISYNKKTDHSGYIDLVKQYQDTAAKTYDYYGQKIDFITNDVQSKLAANKETSEANVDYITSEIRRYLRTAELQGELTWESIQGALNKARKDVLKQKAATTQQWDSIVNNVSNAYQRQNFMQRFFTRDTASSAWFNQVGDHLRQQGSLTADNVNHIVSLVRERVSSVADWSQDKASQDKTWFQQLKKDLEKNSNMTQEQISAALSSVEADYNSYKAFAIDYANGVYDNTQAFVQQVKEKLQQTGELTQAKINDITTDLQNRFSDFHWFWQKEPEPKTYFEQMREDLLARKDAGVDQVNSVIGLISSTFDEYVATVRNYVNPTPTDIAGHVRSAASSISSQYSSASVSRSKAAEWASTTSAASSAVSVASSAAASATDAAASSASSLVNAVTSPIGSTYAKATDAAQGWQSQATDDINSFVKETEQQMINAKEYSQSQINWLKEYLNNNFHDKKSVSEKDINDATNTIRNYFSSDKPENKKDDEALVDHIKAGLESWKNKLYRKDEL